MLQFFKKIPLAQFKAFTVRIVFATHCFLIVSRVVEAYSNSIYWLLLIPLIGLVVETTVILLKRAGKEWTWFSPAIFFYLATAVPPIWLLEIQLSTARIQSVASGVNVTTNADAESSDASIDLGIRLDLAGWALAMEQALLFILILGRWFMPKGNISRNQLSQLLLVYIGMAADIMELFEVFKEDQIALSLYLTYPTLGLWSVALLQYTLSISSTKSKKPRYGGLDESDNEEQENCWTRNCGLDSINVDVIGIVSSILMQDGPFLCYRLYLLVGLNVLSQMMVFFTCKNILVILLQIYRLVVIYLEDESDKEDEDNQLSVSDESFEEPIAQTSSPVEENGDMQKRHKKADRYEIQNNPVVLDDEENKPVRPKKSKVTPAAGKSSQLDPPHIPQARRSWEEHDDDAQVEHPHSTETSNGTT